MRWRSALVLLGALALLGFRDPGGCGGGDARAGINGPCTRTKDCDRDLVCLDGVCVAPDAGGADAAPDALIVDANADGGDP